MTLVTLPFRPKPGDPEDVNQVMADFDAILTVLNGDIRNDNISASAAIVVSKLAAGATDAILETVAGVPTWRIRDACRAWHNANQNINDAAYTTLSLNQEQYDKFNGATPMHDLTTNNSRIVVRTDGVYEITAAAVFAANATGVRACRILGNIAAEGGAGFVVANGSTGPGHAVAATTVCAATKVLMAAGDFVELQVYQNSGGVLACNTSGEDAPQMTVTRVA